MMEDKKLQELAVDVVKAQIVNDFPPELKKNFIQEAVASALRETARYSNETIIQKTFRELINNEARKIFDEWINENRQLFKDALLAKLNENKQNIITELVESMGNKLCALHVGVNLDIRSMRQEAENDG